MSTEPKPDNAAEALKAVRAFLDIVRKHVDDDDNLAIALISTGAALMASTRGSDAAISALRRAVNELRRGEQP